MKLLCLMSKVLYIKLLLLLSCNSSKDRFNEVIFCTLVIFKYSFNELFFDIEVF